MAACLIHKRSSNKALTVIELLVVVGVVTLLLSLSVACFLDIRERAKQVKCLAQLRQIAPALVMYADDHDGYGPATPQDGIIATNEVTDGIPDLPIMLSKYKIGEELFLCPKDQIAYFHPNFGSSYIFFAAGLDVRLFEEKHQAIEGWVDISGLPLIGEGMGLHQGANNIAYRDGHVELKKP